MNQAFKEQNGFFVLAFENMIFNGEKFFQPIKNNKITYENIRKIATGERDDYTAGCLLDYPYFMDIKGSTLFSKKQKKLF